MSELIITSPAFKNGEWIPNCCSGYGEDLSPELIIERIDPAAVSIVITLDDMGHPIIPGYNHWVAWNLPPVRVIPASLPKGSVLEQPLHIEQGLAYGRHCYRGPKPPFNWCHDYKFTVYTLDTKLSLSAEADKAAVLAAAAGHILQKGILVGKYQRKHRAERGGTL